MLLQMVCLEFVSVGGAQGRAEVREQGSWGSIIKSQLCPWAWTSLSLSLPICPMGGGKSEKN